MMMQWKQSLTQSWTRRLRSPPHVSVTSAVLLVFATLSFLLLLLLLLSSTSVSTLSIAGSAALVSSLTSSNVTAGFFFTDKNNMYNSKTETPAAPQLHASDIASDVGNLHQEDNCSATKLHNVDSSNAVATVMPTLPSIDQSVLIPALSPAAPPQQNLMVQLEEEEVHDVERLKYGVDADQNLNIDWSPVAAAAAAAAPSVLRDKMSKNKPEDMMMNHTDEEKEASTTTTVISLQPLLLESSTPSPSPAAAAVLFQDEERQSAAEVEKFLVPILSYQVGAGNQLMEYMSAAIMARALNRTLCLADFFPGPSRHTGRSVRVGGGLAMEDRYDKDSLSRFVHVTSKKNCLQQCHRKLDAWWLLKPMRKPKVKDWKSMPGLKTNETLHLSWDYVRWQTPADIAKRLGSFSNAHCVAVGGLFPGLRWRGGFLAVSAFLQPSKHITALADDLQAMAIGINVPYLAVHWRFEQSECGSRNSGLCFVRCGDGALIDSGLHPDAKEWIEMSKDQCKNHALGVGLDKFDLFNAIFDRAQNYSLKTVYLATDGWIRGPHGAALVKEAVEELRNRGLAVVGLWNIKHLPNFPDGTTFDPKSTLGTMVNGHQIALVEQEICTRSNAFLGSSQSTWSLAVFRLRLAHRRVKQILESHLDVTRAESSGILQQQGDKSPGAVIKKQDLQQEEDDEAVIEELMKDDHAAGLQCRYDRYFNRIRANATVETYADEVPDGWLDLEACEGRIGHGGKCTVAKCI